MLELRCAEFRDEEAWMEGDSSHLCTLKSHLGMEPDGGFKLPDTSIWTNGLFFFFFFAASLSPGDEKDEPIALAFW